MSHHTTPEHSFYDKACTIGRQNNEIELSSRAAPLSSLPIPAAFFYAVFIITMLGFAALIAETLTSETTIFPALLLSPNMIIITILIPLFTGPIVAFVGKISRPLKNSITLFSALITFLLVLSLYPQVAAGDIVYEIPKLLGKGLFFRVDMLSYFTALLAVTIWIFTTLYTLVYMQGRDHLERFYLCYFITLGSILGTVMATEFFTLFLFFEMMTIASYFLVIHDQTAKSMKAGTKYIFMGIAGGLCLLLGIILLSIYGGTIHFTSLAADFTEMGSIPYIIGALFLVGFGLKAGMYPFHVWMPDAYTHAPTPINTLSSGIMIKVGAYGMIRVFTIIFMPALGTGEEFMAPLWLTSQNIGMFLIWLGIITMAVGVFMALQQGNMKTMLAYHSISQMGYVIMGIGVAAYLGYKGAMGFSGSIYHMVNHSLFKGLLFMVAGAVLLQAKELDMYKLGGLWKKMPVTGTLCLIACLGITGMPLFNGFVSKSLLHHSIDEAYYYGHSMYRFAEIMFTIVSAGTAASFIKLFGLSFFRKCPEEFKEKYNQVKGDNPILCLAMTGMALFIVLIGLLPHYGLNTFLLPAARSLNYDPQFISTYIQDIPFFTLKELFGMVQVYILGAAIFYFGMKFHLFHVHLPKIMCIEEWLYKPIYRNIIGLAKGMTNKYELVIIRSDVLIYIAVLTGALILLLLYG